MFDAIFNFHTASQFFLVLRGIVCAGGEVVGMPV
jgi:hypothetical protein